MNLFFDMKHLSKLYFLIFIVLYSACSETVEVGLRLGEIRATFINPNGRAETLSFPMETNVSAQDGYGYIASLKYLSIFKRMSPPNTTTLHIRITNFDLASVKVPLSLSSNPRLTLNLPSNEIYEGKNGAITLIINKITDDILEGTFSGTITNQFAPNDVYTVRNGEVKVKIQRF